MPPTKTSENLAVTITRENRQIPVGMLRSLNKALDAAQSNQAATEQRLPTATWRAAMPTDQNTLARALVETYQQEAGGAEPAQASLLFTEIARLYEDVLHDDGSAAEAARKALAHDQSNDGARRILFRIAGQAGQRFATQELPTLLASPGNGRRDVNGLLELASYEEIKLSDYDRAAERYRAVLEANPDNVEAQEALQRHYLRREDWPALCESYIAFANSDTDPASRSSFLLAAALVGEHMSTQARAHLATQALETNPSSVLALEMALNFHLAAGNRSHALEILTKHAEQDPEDSPLAFQLSWLLAADKEQIGTAVDYAQRAVAHAPQMPLYRYWLAELYRRSTRWEELAKLLQKQIEQESRVEDRLETYLALGDVLFNRLNQLEAATETLEAAVKLAPSDVTCLRLLGHLYAVQGRWEDLAKMHLTEANATSDLHVQAMARYRYAQVLTDHFDKRKDAIAQLEQAVTIDPDLFPAVYLLEDLYRSEAAYEKLVALLEKRADSAPSEDQCIAYLEEVATLQVERLDDPRAAINTYRRIMQIDPLHHVALRVLPQLFKKTEHWPESFAAYRKLVEQCEDAHEKASLLLHMADIAETHLEDLDRAISCLNEAIGLVPSDHAFAQLGRLYYALSRWCDLATCYQQQLELSLPQEKRVRLLFRLGLLQEQQVGNLEAAVEAYRQVLTIDDNFWPALRGLTRISRQQADTRLAQFQATLFEQAEPGENRQAALVTTALTLEESEPATAKEILTTVLAENGSHAVARSALIRILVRGGEWQQVTELLRGADATVVANFALHDRSRAITSANDEDNASPTDRLATRRWLDQLYAANNDLPGQADTLKQRSELEADPARKRAAKLRLATLADLNQLESIDPIAVCHEILAEDPRETRALDLLERAARRSNDHQLLLEVMEQRAKLAPTAAERVAARSAQAALLLDQGKSKQATELWRSALAEDPNYRPAYEALKQLYAASDESDNLLWVLETGLQSVRDARSKMMDLLRRADLHAATGAVEKAEADLQVVLATHPDQPNALERLEAICRERGDLPGIVSMLTHAAEAASAPQRQAALYLQLGRVQRDELENLEEASRSLMRAIQADPDNVPALLLTADVELRLDQPTEAIALFNRAALRAEDTNTLLAAHLGAAFISHVYMGDPLRARTHLQQILEIDPDNADAISQHVDVAAQLGDVKEQEQLLRKLITIEGDPETQANAMLDLAQLVSQKEDGNSEETAQLLEQALTLKEDKTAVLSQLVQIYQKTAQWEALEQVLAQHIDAVPTDKRYDLLFVRGKNLAQHLQNAAAAREVLREVLATDPTCDSAAELLLTQLDEESLQTPEVRCEAIDLHRRVLARNPRTVSSLRALRELCTQAERTDEAFNAESCLVVLGEATEEEAYFFKQRRSQLPSQSKGSLSAEQLQRICLPHGDHPVRPVVATLKPHLARFLSTDLSAYGLATLDSGQLAEDASGMAIITDCATILGVNQFDVLSAMGGAAAGAVEPAKVAHLIIPSDFARLSVPQQRFLAGRLLTRIALNTECFDPGRPEPLSQRDLELLLAALIRTTNNEFGADVAPAAILDDMGKRLEQGLSKKQLEKAQKQAQAVWSDQTARTNLSTWLDSIELGACRVGLLCCGRLDVAINCLELTAPTNKEAVVGELLSFTAAQDYADLRGQLKLALKA